MKKRLLDHLVCPIDKTPLELCVWEAEQRPLSPADVDRANRFGIDPSSLEEEIICGVLVNRARKLLYPVYRGVPRLLVFRTGLSDEFAKANDARLKREFAGYSVANEAPMPGEADVLRTFSSEWVNYDWDGKAYWNLEADAWFKCMDFALDISPRTMEGKLCLEAGIGIGGVANHVASDHSCEVVGLDLGYSVDAAYKHFGKNPFLHIVQASVFRPPFPDKTFDLVYSFGVIHHTYSTKTAFDSLARLPKSGGRFYLWVYSPYNESRTLQRRVLMATERMLRPIVWRLPETAQAIALLPFVPLYMGMQWWRNRRETPRNVRYGFREAMHAARDRFTPPYVHRHSEEEVSNWFRTAGFEQLLTGSERNKPDYVPLSFVTNTGVSGIRSDRPASVH